jgi:AcrR family transcriptional regulator
MPKAVDHEERRRELGNAVLKVIRRRGVEAASVRAVAAEAGWSPGSIRYYFPTQSELLAFALELITERITRRVDALELTGNPRSDAELILHQLLPLDAERRAENEVWLAFTGRALADPKLRALHRRTHDELREGCRRALEPLIRSDGPRRGLDLSLETERLHALIDGLAVHGAMRPERMSRSRIVGVLDRHLDSLMDEERDAGTAKQAQRR